MFLPSYLMRTHGSRHQQDAVKGIPARQMQKVYEVRNTILPSTYVVLLLVIRLWGTCKNDA